MDTKTLLAVYNITEEEATAYVNAKSNVERQIIDITRISRLNKHIKTYTMKKLRLIDYLTLIGIVFVYAIAAFLIITFYYL